jgi:adiponectin receptor
MIGLVIVMYICVRDFPMTDVFLQNTRGDNLIIYGFLLAAAKCLVNSSLWHTYSCFAHYPTRKAFACVDYTGITVLITASIVTVEYCALYKYPKLLLTYVICAILCGAAGLLFNWSPYFDKPECRSIRIGFFIGLSASGASSLICKAFYDGLFSSLSMFAPLIYKSFIWYLLGVVFYGGLIPERWRYDIIIEEHMANTDRTYLATDVIMEKLGHDGEEEMEELHQEFEEIIEESAQDEKDEDEKFHELINKHFKSKLTKSPYCNNFLSLWWVDYFLASHNIWHICVVLGILGHYFCVLDMFRGLDRTV